MLSIQKIQLSWGEFEIFMQLSNKTIKDVLESFGKVPRRKAD